MDGSMGNYSTCESPSYNLGIELGVAVHLACGYGMGGMQSGTAQSSRT